MLKNTQNVRLTVFFKMLPFLRQHKLTTFLIIIFRMLMLLVSLVTPFAYKYYLDNIIHQNVNHLPYVVLAYVVLFIVQTLLIYLLTFGENRYKNRLRISLKKVLLRTLSTIKMNEYEQYKLGDLRNIVEEDTLVLEEFLFKHCIGYGFSILTILSLVLFMFIFDWHLALLGILMISLSFVLTRLFGQRLKEISLKTRAGVGDIESFVYSSLQNWKEIKTSNLEDVMANGLKEKWKKYSSDVLKHTFYNYFAVALNVFNMFVVTRLCFYLGGGVLVYYGILSIATMLIIINYYEQLNSEMTNLTKNIIELKSQEPQIMRVFDVIEIELEPKNDRVSNGNIEVENLNFCYPNLNAKVLNGLTMTINKYDTVAIVGKSGSGKSTFLKLLLNLLEPNEGSISINGVDVLNIKQESLYHVISAVMQDPQFFNMSIYKNLLLVKPNASESDIISACMLSNIHEDIICFPDGYDTLVGERGGKLSGGQLQRLAIARILLLDPDIIIFDEVTSSLDIENEYKILDSLQKISEYKTIIAVTHRLSTVKSTDYLFLLSEGKVGLNDSTAEILESSPKLIELFSQL